MAKKKKDLVRISDVRVNRIIEYINKVGLSKAQLSRLSDVSQPHIIKVLNGTKKLNLDVLEKISEALNLPLSYFNEGVYHDIIPNEEEKTIYVSNSRPQKALGYRTADGKLLETENDVFSYERDMYKNIIENIVEKNGFFTSSGIKVEYAFECDSEDIDSFEERLDRPGWYMWLNTQSYKPYVGSAANIYKRAKSFINFNHGYAGTEINEIRRKTEVCDWHFFVLEFANDNQNLKLKEMGFISKYKSIENGFNIVNPTSSETNFTELEAILVEKAI